MTEKKFQANRRTISVERFDVILKVFKIYRCSVSQALTIAGFAIIAATPWRFYSVTERHNANLERKLYI